MFADLPEPAVLPDGAQLETARGHPTPVSRSDRLPVPAWSRAPQARRTSHLTVAWTAISRQARGYATRHLHPETARKVRAASPAPPGPRRRECPVSHHLDTPLAAQTGQLFLDDLYVFPGEDSTVFVMDVNSNVNGLHSEPGFHPEARYEFKVHLDGAAYEDLTWRVSFGEPDSGGRQALQVHALDADAARDDAASGELVLEGRTGETASGNGTRVWAGRIADSFYIDLSLLALINGAVAKGTAPDLSGWRPQDAKNSFAGSLVYSIVLEIPHTHP